MKTYIIPSFINQHKSINRKVIMKNIHHLTAAIIISSLSLSATAQTVTAVDSTIEGAEKKISALATKQGKSYEILGASFKNRVYMSAELTPTKKK
ncbi:hypothetical protein FR760_23680 (plasmid) [Enterobacter hormaechei]|nr:hypothetical protein FR760_23680 [Enterobacter hormaechei]